MPFWTVTPVWLIYRVVHTKIARTVLQSRSYAVEIIPVRGTNRVTAKRSGTRKVPDRSPERCAGLQDPTCQHGLQLDACGGRLWGGSVNNVTRPGRRT